MTKVVIIYKGYTLTKCYNSFVDGGYYYSIDKGAKHITNALTLDSAKELIDSDFDYRYMV